MKEAIVASILLMVIGTGLSAWQDGVPINSALSQDNLKPHILGEWKHHEKDHLKLLAWDEQSLLIGARDGIFNLTSRDLNVKSMVNWTASADHRTQCQVKGQEDADCHNFIRVLHGPIHHVHHHSNRNGRTNRLKKSYPEDYSSKEAGSDLSNSSLPPRWIVCGTNAFKPMCRYYDENLETFTDEFPGAAYSPYSPTHKSTSILHHGSVYTATVADFGGADSLIYRAPLRTEQYDLKHLNSPEFVSSISYNDLALFFFRELAIEHTNCGKLVYSRIGRICRYDNGSRKHLDRFTTFLKARLTCTVPGDFPFYFDYIQGTSSIFEENQHKLDMIYAVFTTPENSIRASAVCAFTMDDLIKVFDGPFKSQPTFESSWVPVAPNDVPSPRPGSCPQEPDYYPDTASLTFYKAHPLMDETIVGKLVMVHPSTNEQFTVIEVDSSTSVEHGVHILYIGTTSGKVLKAIVPIHFNQTEGETHYTPYFNFSASYVSASWEIFPGQEIKTIKLLPSNTLIVGSESQVKSVPVQLCSQYFSCGACIRLRDPHCFWDLDTERCVSEEENRGSSSDLKLRQDISSGDDQFCPPEIIKKNEDEVTEKDGNLVITLQANDILSSTPSIEKKNDSAACCPCPLPPKNMDDNFRALSQNETSESIPDQEISFSAYNPNSKEISNEIPNSPTNCKDDFYSSSVISPDGMTRSSVVLASVGSGILALLIGFFIGFVGSQWLMNRKRKTKTAATNAQLAAAINEQSQRLTATKPIDFVMNMNVNNRTLSANPLKNNLNHTDTLEKTVKKIYL